MAAPPLPSPKWSPPPLAFATGPVRKSKLCSHHSMFHHSFTIFPSQFQCYAIALAKTSSSPILTDTSRHHRHSSPGEHHLHSYHLEHLYITLFLAEVLIPAFLHPRPLLPLSSLRHAWLLLLAHLDSPLPPWTALVTSPRATISHAHLIFAPLCPWCRCHFLPHL